ncbi:hypothetical protein FB639_001811 [Coemansia asiatica]|nr:hypothetical protein FB639_001811 [Coemansia asiatica]
MLLGWAAEHRRVWHFSPDKSRAGPENAAKRERSLRAWFRRNGFVPLLNKHHSQNTDDRRHSDSSTNAIYERDSVDAVVTKHVSGSKPGLSDLASKLNISGVFCAACGTLVMRKLRATKSDNLFCCVECERVGRMDHTTVSSATGMLSHLPRAWDNQDDNSDYEELLMVDDDTAAYADAQNKDDSASIATQDLRLIAASLHKYHLTQQEERNVSGEYYGSNVGKNDDSAANDDDGTDTRNIGNIGNDKGYGVEANHGKSNVASDEQLNDHDGADDRDEAEDQNEHAEDDDDQAIDWVWSAIRPLELNCAPASRFSNSVVPRSSSAQNMPRSLVQLPNCSDEAFGEALDQRLVVGRLLLDVTKMFLRDLVSSSDRSMRQNRAAVAISQQKPSSSPSEEIQAQLLMLNPLHVLSAIKKDPDLFDFCSNAYLAE